MPRDRESEPNEALEAVRLLDANLNRALEGLRVIEDLVRFGYEWQSIAAECKTLRHRLASEAARLDRASRMRSRDTAGDVGTSLTSPGEYERHDTSHLLHANCERVKQSLRVIEEVTKLWSDASGDDSDSVGKIRPSEIESIRYAFYQFEKRLLTSVTSRRDWRGKQLYVLVDGQRDKDAFAVLIGQLIRAGVDVIQLRDKNLSDRDLLERARQLVERTRDSTVTAIINDRPDIARLSLADGVHVGQTELPLQSCRQIVGPSRSVGISTHSVEQAKGAEAAGR